MELSIDTASETASVAVSTEGAVVGEITWRCKRNHTVELLPTISRLLEQVSSSVEDLRAVFVCTGPGMYTGLRVGVSTAQGLARGRNLALVGVGRLEVDAYPYTAFSGTVVAVHQAGRGDLAWAAYGGSPAVELVAPRLSSVEEFAEAFSGPTLLVGEVDAQLEERVTALWGGEAPAPRYLQTIRHGGTLAEIGHRRLGEGVPTDPALVAPIYLRPPAIGPQHRSG
jgi:tRNA threonylcarbamoyladenosine biosynthesis protein TsaB